MRSHHAVLALAATAAGWHGPVAHRHATCRHASCRRVGITWSEAQTEPVSSFSSNPAAAMSEVLPSEAEQPLLGSEVGSRPSLRQRALVLVK